MLQIQSVLEVIGSSRNIYSMQACTEDMDILGTFRETVFSLSGPKGLTGSIVWSSSASSQKSRQNIVLFDKF